MTFVLFGLAVIVDANEQQIVSILRHLFGIVSPLDLRNCRVGIPVIYFSSMTMAGESTFLRGMSTRSAKPLPEAYSRWIM